LEDAMPPSLDQARVVLATQPFSRLLGARLLLAPVVGDRLLARAWVVSAGQRLIVARRPRRPVVPGPRLCP
jgi:hypothetical protein